MKNDELEVNNPWEADWGLGRRRNIKRATIREVFKATLTGQQWAMFQVMFLDNVAQPVLEHGEDGRATRRMTPDDVLRRYNATLGAVEPSLLSSMQQQAKTICGCTTFRDYFAAIQHPRYGDVPTEYGDRMCHGSERSLQAARTECRPLNKFEVNLYDIFRQAEQASLLRQYHRPARHTTASGHQRFDGAVQKSKGSCSW